MYSYEWTYMYERICMNVYVWTHMYVCMYVCIYVCMYPKTSTLLLNVSRHVRSDSTSDSTYNVHRQYIRLFSFNRKLQLRALRHESNKRIYNPKSIERKGYCPLSPSPPSPAFEGKSEILRISWRKGVKVANVLITNVIDAIEI